MEIRLPPKLYKTNLHPIFNMDELDLEDYSLYNQQNIIFFRILFLNVYISIKKIKKLFLNLFVKQHGILYYI